MPNASDMSLQVCSCCGWSKFTTYHGLRVHQGKKRCTKVGMRIPESEQYRIDSYFPKYTYMVPPIKVEEPLKEIYTPFTKSVGGQNLGYLLGESHQKDSGPIHSTPVKKKNVPLFGNLTTPTIPAINQAAALEIIMSLFETQQHSLQTATSSDKTHRALDFAGGAQPILMSPASQTFSSQVNPAAAGVIVKETNKSLFETPQRSHEPDTKARRALDFSTGAFEMGQLARCLPTTTAQETAVRPKEKVREAQQTQKPILMSPASQTFSSQVNPAAAEVIVKETNKSLFETPQRSHEPDTKARRALDFSTGAFEAKQERIWAEIKQNIQMREQKMAEVRSYVTACKGSLDTEWLEINAVFSEVMRVVEDAWQKALQPLEERRHRVKRDTQGLIQKLQKEIDKLKKTIDELDENLQVSPLTGLDESQDWKNVAVDSSFSFGTLRTETSNMMEQIRQKLEKLSPVELKRITTFAVNVKLDPATAHQCLVLSPDGKEVRDGGTKQKVPDAPERFDMFGSVLGLNRLTSGKSYWEVEVSNKTGWDLGVARGDANRKGILSLNPDNGYWVTVHYEDDKYAALTAPPVCLSLAEKPQKVGVFVDYEEGLVSFYDVTAQSHIYSFTECSFREEIFPYFSPHLKHSKKNSSPLIISAMKEQ